MNHKNELDFSTKCSFYLPPFLSKDFEHTEIGIDMTKGRYGEVSALTCKHCHQIWLHYFVEYEAFKEN